MSKKYQIKPKILNSKRILVGNQNESDEYVYIGRVAELGPILRVDFDLSQPHVVAIFGKRGSGKSYTLGSFLEGLCTVEKENSISNISRKKTILLFDTLGIFQWFDIPISKQTNSEVIKTQLRSHQGWDFKVENLDVDIWHPKGFESNCRIFNEFTINCADINEYDWGYLLNVDIFQDPIGRLLYDTYYKVTENGWTNGKEKFKPAENYSIEDLLNCLLNDTELPTIYHPETIRALSQKLSVYSKTSLFQPKGVILNPSQPHKNIENIKSEGQSAFKINNLLKAGKLNIILLHKLSDELRCLLIISLIRKIMRLRVDSSEIEKNELIMGTGNVNEGSIIPPVWIVIDEAQNFLPSEKLTSATDILVKLVREGRNYGISFMITTQQPTAIEQRILSQVDTMIVHKLTVQNDIDYVKRNIKSPLPEEIKYNNNVMTFDSLLRSLDVGQAIVSSTDYDRAFVMDVRPRISVHGGF